jgi:hypothetical protein
MYRSAPILYRSHIDLIITCSRCGRDARLSCGERARSDGVRYAEAKLCEHCGDRYEADGLFAPRDVRTKILDRDGAWAAGVEDVGPDRSAVVKLFREHLGLSVGEALNATKEANYVLGVGTRTEMESLAPMFREAQARVAVAVTDTKTIEQAFLRAVIRGDFNQAERDYDAIARAIRRRYIGARSDGLDLESKGGLLERIVRVGGPWSIVKKDRALVFGFDEHMVVSPRIAREDQALVDEFLGAER